MENSSFFKTTGKRSSLLNKMFLLVIACISSSLSAQLVDPLEGEAKESPLGIVLSDDLMAFDTSVHAQSSILSQEMQFPKPIFESSSTKYPLLAGGLSFLIPGLGHVYLKDVKTAGTLFGTTGIGVGTGFGFDDSSVRWISFATAENIWSYSTYAAYRDARICNGLSGYSYKMPLDSLGDLISAPFSFHILKKPEVWAALLFKLAIALGIDHLGHSKAKYIQSSYSIGRALSPLVAVPVGVGEEALFRGLLQTQLSEWFDPWTGILLSSLAFGAAHIPNAKDYKKKERQDYYTFSIPLITLSGIYYGWLTYNNASLKESVAIHTWYDFVLLCLESSLTQSITKGRAEFAFATSF